MNESKTTYWAFRTKQDAIDSLIWLSEHPLVQFASEKISDVGNILSQLSTIFDFNGVDMKLIEHKSGTIQAQIVSIREHPSFQWVDGITYKELVEYVGKVTTNKRKEIVVEYKVGGYCVVLRRNGYNTTYHTLLTCVADFLFELFTSLGVADSSIAEIAVSDKPYETSSIHLQLITRIDNTLRYKVTSPALPEYTKHQLIFCLDLIDLFDGHIPENLYAKIVKITPGNE